MTTEHNQRIESDIMTNADFDDMSQTIEGSRTCMIKFLRSMVECPAIAPESGGNGEWEKAVIIENYLAKFGFDDIEHYDAIDPRVSDGKRPNLIAWIRGKNSDKRLLVVTHIDVVPSGDLDQWETDPFIAVEKKGRIYGRGTEDNGQSLTASIFAAKAFLDMGLKPEYDVGLVLVADEEIGAGKGMEHLVAEGAFRKDDMILVPDHGEPEGRLVEVSEKSLVWVKISTRGEQCHASMPDLGCNAFRSAMRYGLLVDEALHKRFNLEDRLFDRPISTFEPTKKEENIPNINTVPGEDVFYIDCRLLPQYKVDDMLVEMRRIADDVELETGLKIELTCELREDAAPPTPEDAPIVQRVLRAVERVYGNKPYPGGIGGGTCAAILRRAGHHVAVWEKVNNMAHAPNEYSVIDNLVNDCKAFASLYTE